MADGSDIEGFPKLLIDLADKASGKAEDSKGSSFLVYLILTGLVMLGFAVMGLLVVSAKRRAAQMEYELRKKLEDQKRSIEQVELDVNEKTRKAAEDRAVQLKTEIQELKEQIKTQNTESVARASALAKAASWDDVVIVPRC